MWYRRNAKYIKIWNDLLTPWCVNIFIIVYMHWQEEWCSTRLYTLIPKLARMIIGNKLAVKARRAKGENNGECSDILSLAQGVRLRERKLIGHDTSSRVSFFLYAVCIKFFILLFLYFFVLMILNSRRYY